jgi:murein peptide amidase A
MPEIARIAICIVAVLIAGCAATPKPIHAPLATTSRPAWTQSTMGQSRQGLPIQLYEFGPAGASPVVLIFAGIHGNEKTTTPLAFMLIRRLQNEPELLEGFAGRLVIVPEVNPDGMVRGRRTNARGVDLNRNFPATNWKPSPRGLFWTGPEPLSEVESKLLHDLVLRERPDRILSIHSIARGRHGVNFDGPAAALAQAMSDQNGFRVLETIGYPTPGSFGSWAGIDLQIPTITLELIASESSADAWVSQQSALLRFIRFE